MIVLFAIGGVVVALAALAGSRAAPQQLPPPADPTAGGGAAATVVAPSRPPAVVQTARQDDGQATKGLDLGSQGGILAAAGVVGGLIGAQASFTQEAKDLAVPIGIGVAGAAFLALNVGGVAVTGITGAVVGGAAAGGYLIVPIVLLTVNITAIVDGIVRTFKVGDWVAMVKKISALRAQGMFHEALALYVKVAPTIPAIAQVWPQPGDDWYNASDSLGRPWRSFPGAPDKATAAEVARWPSLIPSEVHTDDGHTIPVRGLFEALQKDCDDLRAYAIASGVSGKTVDLQGRVIDVVTGDRDVRAFPAYATAIQNYNDWKVAIASATPWLETGALPGYQRTPIELKVDAASKAAATVAAAAEAEKRQTAQLGRLARQQGVTVAEAQQMVAEERPPAADFAFSTTGRTQAATGIVASGTAPGSAPAPAASTQTVQQHTTRGTAGDAGVERDDPDRTRGIGKKGDYV